MQDSLGYTPLSLLFKRYRERVKYVIRYLERNRPGTSKEAAHIVQNELGGLWQKARLIVCRMLERNRDIVSPCDFDRQENKCPREAAVARQAAQWAAQRYQSYDCQNYENEDDANERPFRLVHASVALAGYGCPIEMVRLAMSVYPQQVKEMDEDGNLPLHVAAVASSYIPDSVTSTYAEDSLMSVYSNLSSLNPRTPFGTVIDMLLTSYPEAAKIPHGSSGRLPLILALEARQRSLSDGLKLLINAYPAALESKEFDPNLHPYILSLIGKHKDEKIKSKVTQKRYKVQEKTLNHTMPTALYDYLRAGPHLLLNKL
jgi:Molecular chaperone GrpE (heat shock protein)